MPDHEHIRISVEVNLFFQRIMKEHLFFLQTNLQPAAHKYIEKANTLKKRFEQDVYKRQHELSAFGTGLFLSRSESTE